MGRFEHLEFSSEEKKQEDNLHKLQSELSPQDYINTAKQNYLQRAINIYNLGHFERALFYYGKTLQYDEKNEECLIGQCKSLYRMNQLQEAMLWVEKALLIYNDSANLLSLKAMFLANNGNTAKALEYCDAALKICSTPIVWIARGETLLVANSKDASYCFSKSIIEKHNLTTNLDCALSLIKHQQFSLAINYLNNSLQFDTQNYFCWFLLGECQKNLGFLNKAISSYKEAININPPYDNANNALTELKKMSNPISKIIYKISKLLK